MRKLVICPGTGQLEVVEYLDSPLGMLVHRCSRFRPGCAVSCARQCAAQPESDPIVVRDGTAAVDHTAVDEPDTV